MNEEIVTLCHQCFVDASKAMTRTLMVTPTELEDFYRAAYNKAIEDAARDPYLCAAGGHIARRLHELEMK